MAGGPRLAGRKWAAAVRAERRCGRDLAELEGAGERSSGGPRGPSERTSGGPAAAPGERGGDGASSRAGAAASAMFAGLQDLGVANGEDLKETLTNCTEPLKAIEQFQVGPGGERGHSCSCGRLPLFPGWRDRVPRASAPQTDSGRAVARAAGSILAPASLCTGHAGCRPGVAAMEVSVVAPRAGSETDPRARGPLFPQTENGVLLPSLQSALPFLDLHGTPRLEFHQSVFDELRDKLLERVSAIASEGKAEER